MYLEQQLNNTPVVDWELAIKLSGNKLELAKELLALFVTKLPSELNAIQSAKKANNPQQLLATIHKLHGAACYCGIPRLQKILATYETALKKNHDTHQLHLTLESEAQLLLEAI